MQLKKTESSGEWNTTKMDTFWNRIASQKKVFYLKDDETKFIEMLAGFVGTGVNAGDCTIVIASSEHLEMLREVLREHGLYVDKLIDDQRYLPFNAEKLLPRFMINSHPDEQLFFQCISEILSSPKRRKRQIRAYREMSAILLEQGNASGSIELENLWTKYKEQEEISLFCAYPKLSSDICYQLQQIGLYNCKVVSNTHPVTNVVYKECREN